MAEHLMIFLKALFMVGIAEMGDKTQLVVIAFTKKHKVLQIVIGVIVAIFLNNLIAVTIGSLISQIIPEAYIDIIAGVLFLYFAAASLKKDDDEEEHKSFGGLGPVLAIGLTFFLAEFGDKTQIATANLAAASKVSYAWVSVMLGACAGMIIANAIGLLIGLKLGKNIPDYIFKWCAVAIFAVFGIITLYNPLLNMLGAGKGIVTFVLILAIAVVYGYILHTKGDKK